MTSLRHAAMRADAISAMPPFDAIFFDWLLSFILPAMRAALRFSLVFFAASLPFLHFPGCHSPFIIFAITPLSPPSAFAAFYFHAITLILSSARHY